MKPKDLGQFELIKEKAILSDTKHTPKFIGGWCIDIGEALL